jgi:phosphomevalonate kinase
VSGEIAPDAPAVSIPGKVMLSGEYAALHGGTAAMLHVPQRLHLALSEVEPEGGYPPAAKAARRIRIGALADYEQAHGLPHFTLDAREFYTAAVDGGRAKLGLGLSAAEAVGAIAMRYFAAGLEWTQQRAQVLQSAVAAHSEAQGGVGSGADVVACASAGPVLCSVRDELLHITALAQTARPGVPLALFWSGVAADTRQLVGAFERWVRGEKRDVDYPLPGDDDPFLAQHPSAAIPPAESERLADTPGLLRELVRASEALAPAWFSAAPDELFALLDRFDAALSSCCVAAGLVYNLPVHSRLGAWAKRHGGRAKPTGAGGGDMVLLIGDLPLEKLQGVVVPLG